MPYDLEKWSATVRSALATVYGRPRIWKSWVTRSWSLWKTLFNTSFSTNIQPSTTRLYKANGRLIGRCILDHSGRYWSPKVGSEYLRTSTRANPNADLASRRRNSGEREHSTLSVQSYFHQEPCQWYRIWHLESTNPTPRYTTPAFENLGSVASVNCLKRTWFCLAKVI